MSTDFLSVYAVKQADLCKNSTKISPRLYEEYGVNLGLRNDKGVGVLTGLTGISKIVSSKISGGEKVPCDGELWYRGYRIEELISSIGEQEYGFEKVAYLLLMGKLPKKNELREFSEVIGKEAGLVVSHLAVLLKSHVYVILTILLVTRIVKGLINTNIKVVVG